MRALLISVLIVFAAAAGAAGLPTAVTAIVGNFARGPVDFAVEADAGKFVALFGSATPGAFPAEAQARQFFRNGGGSVFVVRVDPARPLAEALAGTMQPPALRGLGALLPLSDLGLLVCPELTGLTDAGRDACLLVIAALGETRPLFTILDPPPGVVTSSGMVAWRQAHLPDDFAQGALYFPNVTVDPAKWSGGSSAERISIGASGTVAAVIAANDAIRGIWKSPAGSTATLVAEGFATNLTNLESDSLNQAGVDSLRSFQPPTLLVWAARTLSSAPEDIYISSVRTRRWITRSLERELSDAAVQANGPALWTSLQQRADAFLYGLYQAGAFAGTRPQDAYFVRCDASTTSAADIAAHRVKVFLGVSMLRPAEFSTAIVTLATLDAARPTPAVPLMISPPIAGEIVLTYPGTPGFRHRLESSPTLAPGGWVQPAPAAGTGAWFRENVTPTGGKRLFRVRTEPGW